MKGWVIFENEEAFNLAHQEAKDMVMPLQAINAGGIAPEDLWFKNITECFQHPTNNTVVAYINGGWPDSLKNGLTFYTKERCPKEQT